MSNLISLRWFIPLLSIPLVTLTLAILFYYKQPKQINHIYGYRTGLSMKNQDTWIVANRLSSEYFLYVSIGFLAILLLLLLVVGKSGLINWFGSLRTLFLIVVFLSAGLALVPIVVTEYKLKQIFTSEGIRK